MRMARSSYGRFSVGQDLYGRTRLLFDGKVVVFASSPDTAPNAYKFFVDQVCAKIPEGHTVPEFSWLVSSDSEGYYSPNTDITWLKHPEICELLSKAAILYITGDEGDMLEVDKYFTIGFSTDRAIMLYVNEYCNRFVARD